MTFVDLVSGTKVFLDANVLIYYFGPDPVLGPPCKDLIDRIDNRDVDGCTSASVLADVTHRLMVVEVCQTLGWPHKGAVPHLRRLRNEVKKLSRYRQALDEVAMAGIRVLDISGIHVSHAADVSRQYGLLSSDALIVAVMQDHGLTQLCSHDADFDTVQGLSRYGPL